MLEGGGLVGKKVGLGELGAGEEPQLDCDEQDQADLQTFNNSTFDDARWSFT